MATFVQIEPDAFNQVFADVVTGDNLSAGNGSTSLANTRAGQYHHVRRPVRGIQVKSDTYATVQVRRSNGVAIQLFDAAASDNTGMGYKNSNFLLQSITEQRAEKHQVILTFGEPYIFFFGEQPRMINVSGVLLNTEDFNWRAEWWENYDLFLRGTQCVRMKTRVYLSWDDIVVEGYVTQCSASEDSSNSNLVQFSFQMFLTNYQNISNVGDPNAHWEGKEINLDPSDIDLPGQGPLSSTALVREFNLRQLAQKAQSSNSLFEFLRNGPIGTSLGTALSLNGQSVDILTLATRFISGRNIRVPIGFTGAAAFDQEVQVALSSIPGSLDIINGSGSNRVVTLQSNVSGLITEFRANLGNKFGPARVGLPLSANEDEFVARSQQDSDGRNKFNNLFSDQLADDQLAMMRVEKVLREFGILTPGYDSITHMIKSAIFGIASIKDQGIINSIKSHISVGL